MIIILTEKKRFAFYQSQLGTTQKVLWEANNKHGKMHGFTENYVKVETDYNEHLINSIEYVHLKEINSLAIVEIERITELENHT